MSEQFDFNTFVEDSTLPGRLMCLHAHSDRVALIGMLSKPELRLADKQTLLVLSSSELFRFEDLTSPVLTSMSEYGPPGGILFMEDVRQIETFEVGGLVVVRSKRSGASVALYTFFASWPRTR